MCHVGARLCQNSVQVVQHLQALHLDWRRGDESVVCGVVWGAPCGARAVARRELVKRGAAGW